MADDLCCFPVVISRVDFAYESAPRAAEAMLWAGRTGDALRETRRALGLYQGPDLTILSGRLLAAGMRACADLAGQARARRDQQAAASAADAADGLAAWVERMGRVPFTDHPAVATIAAWRATWDAERTRVTGPGDPGAWDGAAKAWQDLTDRELTVLRLLAAGRTNPQIGAELYISTSTASVHVSNILRKLGVPSRVQAAALAERAGLLAPRPAPGRLRALRADLRGGRRPFTAAGRCAGPALSASVEPALETDKG
jgi:DNA-binding CsgD family transcriptional regulator